MGSMYNFFAGSGKDTNAEDEEDWPEEQTEAGAKADAAGKSAGQENATKEAESKIMDG